jgi:hypothetical protein
MLTQVDVVNSQSEPLRFMLHQPTGGFVVKNIDGLDPVKATLVSSTFASLDGEQYHSGRRESRNIRFQIGLVPDNTSNSVRDLRRKLYEYFMPKSIVKLRFYQQDGQTDFIVEILGRVESFEAPLFTNDPNVDISLMCFDPSFSDPKVEHISGSTTSGTTSQPIIYKGSIETGFEFELFANRSLDTFTIFQTTPDNVFRALEFRANMVANDVLTISTIGGNKGAMLSRNNVTTSVLYGVAPDSDWLELEPGDNHIVVQAAGAPIPFALYYTTKYGGL